MTTEYWPAKVLWPASETEFDRLADLEKRARAIRRLWRCAKVLWHSHGSLLYCEARQKQTKIPAWNGVLFAGNGLSGRPFMKLSFLPNSIDSPDEKACRIRRWANAWAESFRHETKIQTSAGPFEIEKKEKRSDLESVN